MGTTSDKRAVEDFVAQTVLAIVGVSRTGKKFGNVAYRELKALGYRVYPVHPAAQAIDGERCYAHLADLPERVGGVLVAVRPAQAQQVVREAAEAGIGRVWMQQGSSSEAAERFCDEQGISHVDGRCILMFARPRGIHRLHRWLWHLFGKLPKDPSPTCGTGAHGV